MHIIAHGMVTGGLIIFIGMMPAQAQDLRPS